jgi:hypothetical protein
MTTTQIQSNADYADALIAARRAKFTLFIVLTVAIVIQLVLFYFLRYPNVTHAPAGIKATPQAIINERMQYAIGLLDFAGLVGSILFSLTILLLLHIQLAARVLGVARVTSSFILSLLIALLMFPWQAVLNNPAINYDKVQNEIGMKIPGVLYTWAEVSNPKIGATFVIDPADWSGNLLHWARYVGFPLVTLILLAVAQIRSSRGIRQSLSGQPGTATTPVV